MSSIRHALCLAVVSTAAALALQPIAAFGQAQRVQQLPQAQAQPAATQTLSGQVDPVPTRPDPDVGEVELQRTPQPPQLKVDLALIGSFALGSTQIPWGNIVVIPDASASSQSNGRCVFSYRYATRNRGVLASAATQNRVMLGATEGPILAAAQLPALAAGASGGSSGKLVLSPGESMLYVHADGSAQNAESDEANNLRRVRVTVTGDCR
jgi:CARDB